MLHADNETLNDVARGANGTLTNFTDAGLSWIVDGERGDHVLEFDGETEHVSIPAIPVINGATQLSVSAWVKIESFSTANEGIVAKFIGEGESNRSWGLYVDTQTNGQGDPRIGVTLSADGSFQAEFSIIGTTTLVVNQWYFVAFTYGSATSTNLYLDGQEENSDPTPPGSLHSSAKPIHIGRMFYDDGDASEANGSLACQIDDVRIYNRPLTPNAIVQMHNLQTRWDLFLDPETQIATTAVVPATGGILAGGSALASSTETITPVGGMLVGGAITDLSVIFNPADPTGGTKVGGSAEEDFSDVITPVGGMLVGGAITDLSVIFNPADPTGGTKAGGIVENLFSIFGPDPAGGMLAGGEAEVPGADLLGEGGILVGGLAEVNSAEAFVPVGGVELGGIALQSEEQIEPVSGGILVGGLAEVASAEAKIPVGGALSGGLSEVTSAEAFVPTGGVLLGGVVDTVKLQVLRRLFLLVESNLVELHYRAKSKQNQFLVECLLEDLLKPQVQ
jgi:hypothetical protein